VIGGELGFGRTGRIAQMVRQLAAERPFDPRLLEAPRGGFDSSAVNGPSRTI
jgi:hypothetical protein